MEPHIPMVLGKRGRRDMAPGQLVTEACMASPKRSRARREARVEASIEAEPPLSSKSRSGLLTPEPSILNDCQRLPPPSCPTMHIFPFMKLPAELRLHIYHMALVRAFPISLHADRAPEKPDEDVPQPPRPSIPLPTSLEDMSPSPLVAIPSRRTPRANPDKHEYCEPRTRPDDPVVPEILRLNKQIYKEARQLLYAENVFTLTLASGVYTLSTLHQRSRSLIKHVVLTIPSHHDILDGFADLVRLGLRYCWGLKSFKIILQASLPDDGRISGATSVYANAFHILRWLPRGCSVLLEGCVSETVRKVVVEEGRLMNVLDETSYLKRQHQMPERH